MGTRLQKQSCNHSAAELGAEEVAAAGWTRRRQQPCGISWANYFMVRLLWKEENGFWQRNLLEFPFSFLKVRNGEEARTGRVRASREGAPRRDQHRWQPVTKDDFSCVDGAVFASATRGSINWEKEHCAWEHTSRIHTQWTRRGFLCSVMLEPNVAAASSVPNTGTCSCFSCTASAGRDWIAFSSNAWCAMH